MRAAVALVCIALGASRPDFEALRKSVTSTKVFQQKVIMSCQQQNAIHDGPETDCQATATDRLFCELLQRSNPEMAGEHCGKKIAQPAAVSMTQVIAQRFRGAMQALEAFAPEEDLAQSVSK